MAPQKADRQSCPVFCVRSQEDEQSHTHHAELQLQYHVHTTVHGQEILKTT